MASKSKLLAAAAVVGAVAVGGWIYAGHQATAIARDQIDGFITRNELGDKIQYADVSATPLGTAVLSDVRLVVSSDAMVSIGALRISDLKVEKDVVVGVSLETEHMEIPYLALVREKGSPWPSRPDGFVRSSLGLGYTVVRGQMSLAVRYDDLDRSLTLESKGDVEDAGAWAVKLRLTEIQRDVVALVHKIAGSPGDAGQLGFAALIQGLQTLSTVRLAELELTVDNTGIIERERKVPDRSLPPEEGASVTAVGPVDEDDLVRAGMAPSEARETLRAIDGWLTNGGILRVASNIDKPVPLIDRQRLEPSAAFQSLAGYLVETKSAVSH